MQNHNRNGIVHFTMPKIGEQETDIQDACYWSNDGSLAAIADGASTSLWPREWANILVENFCRDNQDSIYSIYQRWEKWLRPLQEEWRQYSLKIKKDPNIPWYAQGSREKDHGSATFVGLKLLPQDQAGEKRWEALAVGDSCLFQIKANSDELIAFPLDKSEQFTTVTNCFHSLPEYKSYRPDFMDGLYEEGDIFFLVTDALAEWIIKNCENHKSRWEKLVSIASQEEFTNFINQLRDDRLIKNDDTTLLRLKVVIPEGQKTKSQRQNLTKSPKNPDNNLWQLIAALVGISLILGICAGIYLLMFNKKPNSNANQEQSPPPNKVPTSEKPTPTVNTTPTSNNSNLANYPILPIYSAESNNNQKTIGYVWKKASELKSLQLWVHVPKAYLEKIKETDKFTMTIPVEATPLALYIDKPAPQNLSPQDFAGYLLPAQYSVVQPIDSITFKDALWVKVNFRLENKGG